MLLYVLPFIILLVVAIVLKKRQANQQAEPTKKTTAPKAKTTSAPSSDVIEAPAAPVQQAQAQGPQESTPLAPELRRHIENQMRDGNYFAAEAQINQALNRDQSQHELYLMLLDLHLLQNDEFAINQLFSHLRSLQLDDIVQQAQDKRAAHEARLAEEAKAKAEQQAAKLAVSSLSFEQLQQDVQPSKAQAPLEFAPKAEAVLAPVEVEAVKPLEFNAPSTKIEKTEPQALEFNVTPVAPQPTQAQPVQEEVKPLDFAFNLDQAAPQTPVAEPKAVEAAQAVEATEVKPLEFSLDTPPQAKPTELEFNLDAPAPTAAKTELEFNLDTPPKTDLDFSLEVAPQAQPQPTLDDNKAPVKLDQNDFEFNLAEPTPVVTSVPQAETQSFDFKFEAPVEVAAPVAQPISKPAATANNDADPLLQLFPELAKISEVDLNLNLAAEYVRLGAYQDAKSLLAEHEASYTPEQREIAATLRNKIA